MGLSAFRGAIPKVPEEDHPPAFCEPVTNTHQQTDSQDKAATGAGANTGAGVSRPKTEAEQAADQQYEERIEEEYAKREGGA
jgi:hypothetical protein